MRYRGTTIYNFNDYKHLRGQYKCLGEHVRESVKEGYTTDGLETFISNNLGIEHIEDIKADFAQAFEKAFSKAVTA